MKQMEKKHSSGMQLQKSKMMIPCCFLWSTNTCTEKKSANTQEGKMWESLFSSELIQSIVQHTIILTDLGSPAGNEERNKGG